MVTSSAPALRAGFTLIELLVALSVLIILAGLLIAALSALGIGSKKARTATILATVRQALEVTNAQTGSMPSPVEHPLAGSLAEPGRRRAAFVRAAAPHQALAQTVTVLGGSSERIALRGVREGNLPGDQRDRLLLDDDRFADRQVPGLFGMPRTRLTILGARQKTVTRYRRLPVQPVLAPPVVLAPDDLAAYPPASHLVSSQDGPETVKPALDYLFAATGAASELARIGGLRQPPDDDAARLLWWSRVWSQTNRADAGDAQWSAGLIDDPERPDASQHWYKPYRLRGLAVTDAWGREVLTSLPAGGGMRLESTGADGVFRFDPGQDRALDTEPWADAPAGDDQDGERDNVASLAGGRS